ncbi:hypothetical protein BU24DRAFT_497895 [Aaosphaeria arxii CBS 175.79]|uniref:Zn(2)-C6 fungal-type domain-containing protein n=1 Tax=Aaosphaeria arxii CBS 175.79 TaxID=1450172 RepID=A0A6A5X652_9PLEO|nr:uncharacterized protein BU24DRAFT_497895 [Aaosphaeria arxii CBS 175.79]KAF2008429.1 hypothetical protein BU24DRAFT_497895 [Aaosphaeria arxii CBS 175.79]
MSLASAVSTFGDKRRPTACQRCHKRKVKCSGGVPCQNCQIAGTICTFPTRDRNVVVSEVYLQRLQALAETNIVNHGSSTPLNLEADVTSRGPEHNGALGTPRSTLANREYRAEKLTLKHATAEAFVSGLQRLSTKDAESSPESTFQNDWTSRADSYSVGATEVSSYDYVSLNFDTSCENVSIQLPPYPYAVQLVSQFETFMAWEYHWYCRKEFHSSLEGTYRCPDSARSRNRIWLCKMMAVLALGESYNSYEPPLIDLSQASEKSHRPGQDKDTRDSYLPGLRFFEQALSLFKMPSEEPDIQHIEALNLIAFFCYSLNRRKTAYMYAGMSARIANSLMLHIPTMAEGPVVAEYRRRIWWTTFLMDNMVSSEMGLRPAFGFAQAEHPFPSDEHIPPAYQADFWDCSIMTAHLKLCNIRSHILETVGHLQESDFTSYEGVIAVPLRELDSWKNELSPDIVFDFAGGVPQQMIDKPSMRSLASCYLRYHQGYIMLIRPIFFKLLSIVLGKVTDMSSIDGLLALSARCLEAAKCNMRIIKTLSDRSRLAKYGFYDSLHLFSGIMIFSLSRLVNAIRPLSLIQESDDLSLYFTARDLLLSMAACGNLASKGHVQMLEDIERRLDNISQTQDSQVLDVRLDEISPWIDSVGGVNMFLDMSGIS